jgi:hypothetical protein
VKRSQRQQAVCAVALACICAAAPVWAEQPPAASQPQQAEPEATRFEFRAPDGCSSAEDFAARVRRRSWRIRLVEGAETKRSLVVVIQETGAGGALRGTVTVVEPDGATRTRQLKAASCAEAVDALSLIATVTLDPDAMLGEAGPEPEPRPKPVTPQPAAAKPRQPPRFRRAAPVEPYRFSFGLSGAVLLNMAPEPAWGGSASAALELNPGSTFSPFWRLSLSHAELRGVDEVVGKANFAYTLPTLDACPVRLGPRAFGIRPCAFASLGVLEVWGSDAPQKETHSRLYGAAGVALWLGWRVSEAFEIVADGRAGLPFRHDDYAFDNVVFYQTHTPAFSAGVGVAGGFP